MIVHIDVCECVHVYVYAYNTYVYIYIYMCECCVLGTCKRSSMQAKFAVTSSKETKIVLSSMCLRLMPFLRAA